MDGSMVVGVCLSIGEAAVFASDQLGPSPLFLSLSNDNTLSLSLSLSLSLFQVDGGTLSYFPAPLAFPLIPFKMLQMNAMRIECHDLEQT